MRIRAAGGDARPHGMLLSEPHTVISVPRSSDRCTVDGPSWKHTGRHWGLGCVSCLSKLLNKLFPVHSDVRSLKTSLLVSGLSFRPQAQCWERPLLGWVPSLPQPRFLLCPQGPGGFDRLSGLSQDMVVSLCVHIKTLVSPRITAASFQGLHS